MILAVWIFGIGGILANFMIYQQKRRKKLLTAKLISDCLWTLHYGFLGAWSGSAICMIGILRESIFLNENKKWAQGKRWLIAFLVLGILSAILTWKSCFSLLPAVASTLSIFSFWKGHPTLTKILAFPISGCFLIYNITFLSYVGIVNEILVLLSTVIGLIRLRFESRKSAKAL